MAYLNGRLPDSALGTIAGTNRRVLRQLVPQTNALRAAFEAKFHKGLVITDAYRDFDAQVRLREQKGPWAAIPGTSNHGWGRALDLGSMVNVEGSPEHRWMWENGPRFGWHNPRWAHDNNPRGGQEEPWHWEASEVAITVSNPGATGGGQVPAAPDVDTPEPIAPKPKPPQEDDDMPMLIQARGGFWLKDGDRIDGIDGQTLASLTAQRFADGTPRFPVIVVADATFDGWRAERSAIPSLVRSPNGSVSLLAGPNGNTGVGAQSDVDALRAAGAREIPVSDDFMAALGRLD